MKILFVSDTHIGAKRYNLDFFEDAIFDSFESQLELISEEQPDIVIHGGDLLDDYIIPLETFLRLKSLLETYLNKLKHIPFFVIYGNHDLPGKITNNTYLYLLNQMIDNIHLIDANYNTIQKPDTFKLLEEVSRKYNLNLYGLSYNYTDVNDAQKSSINDKIKLLSENLDKNKFNILLSHHDIMLLKHVNNLLNHTSSVPDYIISEEVLKDFDLTLLGHYHDAAQFLINDGESLGIYAGSAYPLSFSQALIPKGSFILDIDTKTKSINNIEFRQNRFKYYLIKFDVIILQEYNDNIARQIKNIYLKKHRLNKNNIDKVLFITSLSKFSIEKFGNKIQSIINGLGNKINVGSKNFVVKVSLNFTTFDTFFMFKNTQLPFMKNSLNNNYKKVIIDTKLTDLNTILRIGRQKNSDLLETSTIKNSLKMHDLKDTSFVIDLFSNVVKDKNVSKEEYEKLIKFARILLSTNLPKTKNAAIKKIREILKSIGLK